MRILGIDPGLATTGIGMVEKQGSKFKLIMYSTLLTPAKTPLENRLQQLFTQLHETFDTYQPDTVAVESLFFSNNAKTAMQVGQARGVILLACHQRGFKIHPYTPNEVKLGVCGYGGAEKKQVQYMVQKLLNMAEIPKPDDAADALAIAICHAHSVRLKSLA